VRTAFLLAAKDLKLRVRDRSIFIVAIIAPLGLAFIFDLILGPIADQEFVPVFAVVDEGGGMPARGLVEAFESVAASGAIELRIVAADEVEQQVEAGSVAAAVVIPAGFSEAVQRAAPAEVHLIGNVEAPTSVAVARSIVDGFAAEIEAIQLSVATVLTATGTPPDPGAIAALAEEAAAVASPIGVGDIEAATRQVDLTTFFVAGMAAMFLFFTVQFGVISLLEEKHDGTMSRLLAAPIRPLSIIGGKALVAFGLGLASMAVIVVASRLLLGAEWGDPLGVALLIVAAVFSAVGIMGIVAAFAKTAEQAGNLQSIIAIGLAMLGGIFFPASLGTGILSYLAYISPHRWFLLGLNDLAGGGGIAVIVPSLVALTLFGLVTGGLALMRLRRGVPV
jgi:ABC-2 type transport system permease protein